MQAKAHILTDLDGTLLRPDATLSDFTARVLSAALDQGHVISFATGRSILSAGPAVGAIPWRYPAVLFNGALLLDIATHRRAACALLSLATAARVLDLGRGHDLTPFLFVIDAEGTERILHQPAALPEMEQFLADRAGDARLRCVQHLEVPAGAEVLEITYTAPKDQLDKLHAQVQRELAEAVQIHFLTDTYPPHNYNLSFAHPNANKRAGALQWAELMGCKPADLIVFGDHLNDLGLFEAAGTRVAMGNAQPELKALATEVALGNDVDGVARWILQNVLGGRV